jgi:adenosylhomocysteine nucleosidase
MILVLVALKAELDNVILPINCKVIEIGVGKINATGAAVQAIIKHDPEKIINFGTAGSLKKEIGPGIYRISKVYQRDMDCRPFGIPIGETPYDVVADIDLNCKGLTLGTGDSFVVTPPELTTDLVDMEGYAIAKVALMWSIPCEIYKFVSDHADNDAIDTWQENVSKGGKLFAEYLFGNRMLAA